MWMVLSFFAIFASCLNIYQKILNVVFKTTYILTYFYWSVNIFWIFFKIYMYLPHFHFNFFISDLEKRVFMFYVLLTSVWFINSMQQTLVFYYLKFIGGLLISPIVGPIIDMVSKEEEVADGFYILQIGYVSLLRDNYNKKQLSLSNFNF